ncbi:MAG TPA: DNA gyrase modulator, partial [Ktedonobacteraceae bacterium]|nr:DNA gyrase modulator [Ktedonobacteraceae bacterium]
MHFNERHVRELLQKVLSYSQAEQTEVLYMGVESALTRFANNFIHQNVAENNAELRVRAVVGKRTGVATTNQLDDESLRRVTEQALEIARLQPENPEFRSLPSPTPLSFAPAYSTQTASFTPEMRAQCVGTIIQLAKERKLEAAGAFSTDINYVAVANSLGIFAYEARTDAEC